VLVAVAVLLALSYGECTQDDAFISFRYARNLLDGHGLVYNPGERVEGFTNPSWTLALAGAMALGVHPIPASVLLGVAGWAAVVGLAARGGAGSGPWGAVAAAGFVALDAQGALEAVEGLETAFYAALLGGAWLALARSEAEGRPPWASTALFAVATLTRPEAPALAAAAHGALLLAAPPGARGPVLRRALAAGAALAVLLGVLTAARLAYYGAWVPNTVTAKTGGLAPLRGLRYLAAHALQHPLWWAAVLLSVRAPLPGKAAAVGLIGAQLALTVAVGGDFKPTGRFVLPVAVPLAALGAAGLLAHLPRRPAAGLAVAAVAALLAVRLDADARGWAAERHANLDARRAAGLALAQNLPPDTLLAVHSAGVLPYYAGLRTIDMWGLTDAHIARAPVADFGAGLAGHERSDPAYVFARAPDVYIPEDKGIVLRPWALEPEPGFPADFAQHYRVVHWALGDGRVINAWVRRGGRADPAPPPTDPSPPPSGGPRP